MRTLLALSAMAAVTTPLAAQSRLGLVAGLSSTTMEAQYSTGGLPQTPQQGFVPGISGTLTLRGNVGMTGEVLYVRRGFITTTAAGSYDLDIRYVELPLLLTARYPVGRAQLIVAGGATLALRNRCSATTTDAQGKIGDVNDCVDSDRGVIVPPTDITFTAGFGLAYHRWSATGRYELLGKTIPANSPGAQLQSRVLLILLGFDFLRGHASRD